MKKPIRKDFFWGSLHVIVRDGMGETQYGLTVWSIERKWTIDIWTGDGLISLRRRDV